MENFIDYDQLQKPTFSFRGNYRAIVEDTADPEQVGRVRVRILGLHSLDPKVTPVDHLPWAEPALSMYYAGGLMTRNNINETIDNPDEDRYLPRRDLKSKLRDIPPEDTTELVPANGKWRDEIMDQCGASGIYTVPRKGSVVWIFFEDESHVRPHYWAAATRKVDWQEQRTKINTVISNKRDEVEDLRNRTLQGDQQIDQGVHQDNIEPVQRIRVETSIPAPKMYIHTLDGIKNEEITSFTSSFGTTYIIVNRNGEERTYIFHRGHSQYIDERGQVKNLVGLSDNTGSQQRNENDSQASEQENDYQMMVANNYELHIIGDFNVYAQNNIYLDAEQDLYATVKRNAGVVVKDGDLDVLCEQGHVNISCPEGNVNVRCQEMQSKVEKNLVIEAGEDIDVQVLGDVVMNVDGTFNLNAQQDINIKTEANLNIQATNEINMRSAVKKETYDQSYSLNTNNIDITAALIARLTGGAGSVELNSGIASISGPNANINGSNVTVGGTVSLGAGSAASPAVSTPAEVTQVDPWGNWRETPEKVEKDHTPTPQVVTDQDSA